MIYAIVFLFGSVAFLAWWLFKLEVASGHFISRREWAEERCKDWEQASRNRQDGLKSLASAIGYEWKSTPAKSGWERKPQSDVEICRSLGEQYAKINARGWHTYMGCADRRKADRRKPVDVQKKKPKRATH